MNPHFNFCCVQNKRIWAGLNLYLSSQLMNENKLQKAMTLLRNQTAMFLYSRLHTFYSNGVVDIQLHF